MILATQAAVEYAALAMRRGASMLGQQFAHARDLAADHFNLILIGLITVVIVLALRTGSGRYR